jgi:microcystin-dependent protein
MSASALGASQAIQYLPAGSMVDFAGTSAPAGWLMCDGRSLPTASYPDLFAALSYSYGGSGANFSLPDFRGRFARYNDNMGTAQGAAGRDSARVHGSSQTDAVTSHGHGISVGGKNSISFGSSTGNGQPADTYNTMRILAVRGIEGGSSSATNPVPTSTGWTSDNSGTETRPINLSCNRIIKY